MRTFCPSSSAGAASSRALPARPWAPATAVFFAQRHSTAPKLSDPQPLRHSRPTEDKRSLFDRLVEFISPGPDSRAELIATLADAEQRELIEPESRQMLEGVLRMADMSAGDVMVAAPRMDLLDIDAPYDELLAVVIETGHSRFPVYDGRRDNVIGILMAKDLLKLQRAPELNLRTLLRPAVFVPESKRLNELLRDFRSNRNHLAIVIDEFGQTAGLITIEDVLEEIVGEIEDEFDDHDEDSGVYTLADGTHRVAGDTSIASVNEAFGLHLPETDFDTIGGLVAHELGRVPRRGETVELGGLRFAVMLARGGAVRWFRVARVPAIGRPSDAA
jgi:magnesium and cobalt transporter